MSKQSFMKAEQMQAQATVQKSATKRPALTVVVDAGFIQNDLQAWNKFLDRKRHV